MKTLIIKQSLEFDKEKISMEIKLENISPEMDKNVMGFLDALFEKSKAELKGEKTC